MPALGMAQDTGTLMRWLKQEGEQVTKGEPLMEVETDKVTVDIEAPATGILANVTAQAGDVIPVAQVIALILAPGEQAPPRPSAPSQPAPAQPAPAQPAPSPAAAPPHPPDVSASPVALRVAEEHQVDLSLVTPGNGGRISKADVLSYVAARDRIPAGGNGGLILASPKARRLAAEAGINLATLTGSGPGGAVLAADVVAAPPVVPPAAPQPGETQAIGTVWRVMAERMTQSWTTVPHFYLAREVDATRLAEWRDLAQQRSDEKVTYTDLLVRAVAAALRQHPRVNVSWENGAITRHLDINIGLAVAVEDGLVVPVIHQADRLSIAEIAARRKELVGRAQAGKLRLDDIQGGTFTLSNLGMYGIDAFHAIVNPPQAAILAVGRIADRVVAVEGQPAVRPMMIVNLSCDHRAVDGARGAQFVETLAALLEEPMGLIA